MSSANFVIGAYAVTAGGVGAYVAWVLARGRRLSRQLPEGRRRWM
jgi:heme exporter protein CcmD